MKSGRGLHGVGEASEGADQKIYIYIFFWEAYMKGGRLVDLGFGPFS